MQFWSDDSSLAGGDGTVLSRADFEDRIDALAQRMDAFGASKTLALAGDNSTAWIVADLAAAQAGRTVVPIPGFFTRQQIAHVCATAGVTHVLINGDVRRAAQVWPDMAQNSAECVLPHGTQKITFTSGTTGQPKGICLTLDQQLATAHSLRARLSALNIRTHLNLLPLAVLLENIAGVYAPLMMGARVVTPALADVGLKGSSDFDAQECLYAIARHKAESIILLPQMLHAMVTVLRADPALRAALETLKFVAVGGAPVPMAVLQAAREMGMPVYEGYGLTECASVCCLNGPDADMPGSVGTALPGVSVGLTDEGEVWIEGRGFAGVLGQNPSAGSDAASAVCADGESAQPVQGSRFLTGDIGQWIEKDGVRFLQIVGRRKHMIITSFGRNVSPQWPERLLMDSGLFRQVVVMGDGQPHLSAVIVPAANPAGMGSEDSTKRDAEIRQVINRVNELLPDYAQVRQWCISHQAFSAANGLATANGRPLRQRIAQQFTDAFNGAATSAAISTSASTPIDPTTLTA